MSTMLGDLHNPLKATYQILYPEAGFRSGEEILAAANDAARDCDRQSGEVDPASFVEITSIAAAMDLLSDLGIMTFSAGSRALAEGH